MNSGLDWRLHPLAPSQGLGPHREAWDDLNRRVMGGHSMLDGLFVDALLRHFGDDGALLATAGRDGEPVAMLLLSPRTRLGIWSSLLPSQTQIGPSLIPAGLDLSGLFAALPGHAGELDLLCNDPRFGDLRELPAKPVKALPHALTMNINLRDGFDDYWAQRPRKLIQNMRRYQRRLQSEVGAQRLDVITDAEAMPAAVARYAALESSGWKGREGTAISSDCAQGRFYVEVMREFAMRGEALVYELRAGDTLLASRMLLLRNGMAVMLKTTFDEQFERYAPGRILLLRTLEDLFTRAPGSIIEFYTNADSDLLAWSTSQRWINHVSVYRYRVLPAAYGLLRRTARGWLRRSKPPMDTEIMVNRSGASVDTYVHVHELPADVIALMNQAEQRHVEFGADWHANLMDSVYAHERRTHEVRIHVLRRQGRVLAVLPIVAQTGALGREVSALSNFYTAIYAPVLDPDIEAEDLLPLTRVLRRGGARAAAYRFSPMDPTSREFALLKRALTLAGLNTYTYFAFGNWYEPVRQSWADYLKERSGQVRSTIKRNSKKFAAEGGRLEIVRGGDELEAGLAAYQAVYAQSWKVPEPYPDFVPGLIRLCARRGWLRLGLAWLGDKPVAAQIWIVAHGRADIYKLAYDEAHKALAPGTLLTALLMEQAIDVDRVHEIDYMIGDDAYKATWMSQRRERFGLVAYDPLTLRGLLGLARQAVGEAWRWLRQKPVPRHDNPAA
ncbi:GNAT family N-acetyltransferase [Roseateles sp.]|uniref:GNAT family N-acetyltransferase n=1 Tax=Roseateles sp. TaxID=1971397 RepID=UPI0025FB0B64|nr:GNAT family N-acetyltransferase [Roseateles sp.]MBV8036901.1 GNAT family N-acetyltransferase [Roseateles sp.]